MQAVVLQAFGAPDNLRLETVPDRPQSHTFLNRARTQAPTASAHK